MDRYSLYKNEGNSMGYGIGLENNELNCSNTEQFFNHNWDNSVDHNDPFESALSSMVCSPAATPNPASVSGNGDNIVLKELIGKLGSMGNNGEISPQAYVNGNNNSTNTSCYSTPMNSPPKLNLSMMMDHHQIRGNLQIPGNHFPSNLPNLAPFSTDPGFVERAARFSCFAQFGLNESESESSQRLAPKLDSSKVSRVSGSQLGNQDGPLEEGVSAKQKKSRRFSRSSTPENGDSRENSSVSEQIPGGEMGVNGSNDANSRKRKSIPRGKTKEKEIPSSSASAKDANVASENSESSSKRSKTDAENSAKGKTDGNENKSKENQKPPEPPKDYIHVRARRGQATDAHSLAERVRREKISERMKVLQDLVPGCNKVTGKAVMLDEIINYVQSLQRQVEFLSMKLATVNPRMDFSMEALISKNIFQSRGSLHHNLYPSDVYSFPSEPGVNLHNAAIPNAAEVPLLSSNLNAAISRNQAMQLPHLDNFGEGVSQVSNFWEDDLQSVVQMGTLAQTQPPNFPGILPTSQMKVEL